MPLQPRSNRERHRFLQRSTNPNGPDIVTAMPRIEHNAVEPGTHALCAWRNLQYECSCRLWKHAHCAFALRQLKHQRRTMLGMLQPKTSKPNFLERCKVGAFLTDPIECKANTPSAVIGVNRFRRQSAAQGDLNACCVFIHPRNDTRDSRWCLLFHGNKCSTCQQRRRAENVGWLTPLCLALQLLQRGTTQRGRQLIPRRCLGMLPFERKRENFRLKRCWIPPNEPTLCQKSQPIIEWNEDLPIANNRRPQTLEYLPNAFTLDEEKKARGTPSERPSTKLGDIGAQMLALAALQCFQSNVAAGSKLDDRDTHGFGYSCTIEQKVRWYCPCNRQWNAQQKCKPHHGAPCRDERVRDATSTSCWISGRRSLPSVPASL